MCSSKTYACRKAMPELPICHECIDLVPPKVAMCRLFRSRICFRIPLRLYSPSIFKCTSNHGVWYFDMVHYLILIEVILRERGATKGNAWSTTCFLGRRPSLCVGKFSAPSAFPLKAKQALDHAVRTVSAIPSRPFGFSCDNLNAFRLRRARAFLKGLTFSYPCTCTPDLE